MLRRISWIFQHDMNVVVRLPLDAPDPSDDLVDVEFLLADAVVPGWTAMRGDRVQRRDAGRDHIVPLNAAGVGVTKALDVGASEGTTRRQRRQRDGRDNAARVSRSVCHPY